MLILNFSSVSNGEMIVSSIKNPSVKNVVCNIDTGGIRTFFNDDFQEDYCAEYQTNRICDFTSDELCEFTYKLFLMFNPEHNNYKAMDFDNVINNLIDNIIDKREEEYDPDDDDSTK